MQDHVDSQKKQERGTIETLTSALAKEGKTREAAMAQASAAAVRARRQTQQLEALAADRDRHRERSEELQSEVGELGEELEELHNKQSHLKRQLLALRHRHNTDAMPIPGPLEKGAPFTGGGYQYEHQHSQQPLQLSQQQNRQSSSRPVGSFGPKGKGREK